MDTKSQGRPQPSPRAIRKRAHKRFMRRAKAQGKLVVRSDKKGVKGGTKLPPWLRRQLGR
jgi:hypothetical protein